MKILQKEDTFRGPLFKDAHAQVLKRPPTPSCLPNQTESMAETIMPQNTFYMFRTSRCSNHGHRRPFSFPRSQPIAKAWLLNAHSCHQHGPESDKRRRRFLQAGGPSIDLCISFSLFIVAHMGLIVESRRTSTS